MSFDLIQPARFIIGILKVLGLWRLEGRWESVYRVYFFVLHFVFTFLNIGTLLGSILIANDLQEFTESLYMSLTEAGLVTKFSNIVYFKQDAVKFIELLQTVCLRNADEKIIFLRGHRTFGLLSKSYILSSAAVVAVSYVFAAFGSANALPYPAWMPFELNSSTFWYAYTFQLMGLTVTCFSNVCIDILQCYYMHHLALIYKVIGYRLSKIGCGIEEDFTQFEINQVVISELTDIIRVHQFAKKMTAKSERLTSFPFFVQVLLSALVLCFTGYQLQDISPLDKPGRFIGTADFLFVLGLQIFLPCYYANQVTTASGQLSKSLYNSNWVDLPQKSRKLVCMYMVFLEEPIYIKAGVFFNIGIPIFAKTINNAYSYFALLVRMKQ